MGKAVTSDQGVVSVDLVIDTGTERGAATWDRNDVTEIRNIIAAIKYQCRYNRLVVDIAFFKINKERCLLLGNGTTKVSAILARLMWRTTRSKRVP